jgi:hypothetical protein
MKNNTITIAVLVAAIANVVVLAGQSALAENPPYDAGYSQGCNDASLPISERYINQPDNGPSNHTQEFMNGYYAGLSACSGGGTTPSSK